MDALTASTILFKARENPALKATQAVIDASKRELDKIDQCSKGDNETKIAIARSRAS